MPHSAADKMLIERIEEDFTHHPPTAGQTKDYSTISGLAKMLALAIVDACPDGPERLSAISRLKECAMWANLSIATKRDV